ncbi:DUF2806 domain-containing protein [Vibrio lentus]|nr:DUF2806 domain-containing protein [Vibrio lentus]
MTEADVEGLEEDWVSHFFDKCEKASDEQMQSLGLVYCQVKLQNLVLYSKRTVDFISSMDKKTLNFLLSFTIYMDGHRTYSINI